MGSLVVQSPRIGGDIRQKVENKGEDPGRYGEDVVGFLRRMMEGLEN